MEKKSIFLDTNIIIDILLNRNIGLALQALYVKASEKEYIMYATTLSIGTAFYVTSKVIGSKKGADLLNFFLLSIEIIPQNKQDILEAFKLAIPDFEDAIQYQAAKKAGCSFLASRDVAFHSLGFTSPEILGPDLILSRISS
jgi:predicted nucleic acid-binding protein